MTTERTFDQIVGDTEMYRRAKDIRKWLVEISGLIPRLNESPNAYYNCTIDGLTLVQYYGGPSLVGTPFGGWAATGGGCLKDFDWFEKAKERLGLEVLLEEHTNRQGHYGPVHAITRDLDGEPLPKTDWRLSRIVMVGIESESAFGYRFHDLSSLKERYIAAGLMDSDEEEPPSSWLPDMVFRGMSYRLNKRLWDGMKSQIDFRDWMDEKKIDKTHLHDFKIRIRTQVTPGDIQTDHPTYKGNQS